ncbi:FCRL1 protein, partial [Hemiprocne comata]|nr:FCRL1 protein [Hemiprocne comata]
LRLQHSGRYRCEATLQPYLSHWQETATASVTVQGIPVSGVSLSAEPPEGQVAEGDRLVLSCSVAAGTGPLSFSWHREGSATPLATGSRYELDTARPQDSGSYHCTATDGGTAAASPPLRVNVL